ncbi:iron ABC transporter permease [Fictibacillus sp. 5RED26]|uniref:FecCD family ABC transporter permease n=1 Tax=unclassified Fictibacillus TaxID=2644029 RepID=UPI0018CE0B6F|nr:MULTISPECIES: iron ABC transporter permease [unclassified Fictibacillus]MBH0158172.1 iron ABC transporter permease [Fictibacillus sp. 5RED26]MBH0167002.1 iron ABC transporter permease [Fictibacillus sp. 7GRE50]MBH0174902.1 iron ABC transporter permease [Fictibacillus sp. 23RED33]
MMNAHQMKRVRVTTIAAILLLIAVFIISVATGFASLTPSELFRTIMGQGTPRENLILFEFRLPRIIVAILAGMGLAVSGAILQSITKNPLSDPGILGINAGAGLMVVVYIMFFTVETTSFLYVLPLFALFGGMLTAFVIYIMSYIKGEGVEPTRLVLVGVGLAAALYGATLTLSTRLDMEDYSFMANWMAGRIWGDDWTFVLSLLPWILLLIPYTMFKSNVLNTLNLHENVSVGVGVNVSRERISLIMISVALASASVAVSGGIAFVGLMAPHIARSLVGPRHQVFLPVAALIGGILLLAADTIGRVVLDPSGIPAGIIVTIIGAPYFMYLLAKK